jgi:hypothetical protein
MATTSAFAQGATRQDSLRPYSDPGVRGMQKPKGIEIKYERILDYSIRSRTRGEGLTDGAGEVRRSRRWDFKAKVPLVNRPAFKLAAGLHYLVEEYRFENVSVKPYPFYTSLEDKSLKSLGASLYLLKSTPGQTFFVIRASVSLNGDYQAGNFPTADYLRVSVSPLLGWKKTPHLSYGLGFSYSYDFGRPAIYPMLVYNQTFNQRWGVEAILPAYVKLRYNINPKSVAYLKAEGNGANYNIRLAYPNRQQTSTYYLRSLAARIVLDYEREIYDFLWCGLEAGVRRNLDFSLATTNRRRSSTVLDNRLNDAFFFEATLFLVPPKRFLKF